MPMSTRQQQVVRERLEKYLKDKHVTLWLDWDLGQSERREEAVQYMLSLFNELELRPLERPERAHNVYGMRLDQFCPECGHSVGVHLKTDTGVECSACNMTMNRSLNGKFS